MTVVSIKQLLENLAVYKDYILHKKYESNIHDMDLTESIESGIVDRLMHARELGIDYCVVFDSLTPTGKSWDKFGSGEWRPPRDYITTDDIGTDTNDREIERQNIYSYLRGKEPERSQISRR